METLYALILIVAPIVDGKIGQDDSYAIDGGLTKYDCMLAAFDRADAAYKVFGPDVIATLSCEPDGAPDTWN
jgi:hypothetical protein